MSKLTRRDFLKIMGTGSAAAMGITLIACKPGREQMEKVVSQLIPAEEITPGIPLWYATTCTECPANCGLLLKTREGRVIKVEGNPDHPINRGSHCMWAESSLQVLYNPDRLKSPLAKDKNGVLQPVTWDKALDILEERIKKVNPKEIAWLTPLLSGSLESVLIEFNTKLGGSRIVQYEPLSPENIIEASEVLFGIPDVPRFQFEDRDLVISLGADFLGTWLSPVEYTKTYAKRRVRTQDRLYHIQIESRMSLTGSNADKWVAVNPGTEHILAGLLLKKVLEKKPSRKVPSELKTWARQFNEDKGLKTIGITRKDFEGIVARLLKARRPLILGTGQLPGDPNGVVSWISALALNKILNDKDVPIDYSRPSIWRKATKFAEIKRFIQSWGKDVKVLFVYQTNPVYNLPGFLKTAEHLKSLDFVVAFTTMLDETAEGADLVLPIRHNFEDWCDAEPRKGIWSIQQPGMQPVPLFDTRSFGEIVVELGNRLNLGIADDYIGFVKSNWSRIQKESGDSRSFDEFWRDALQKGVLTLPVKETISIRLKPAKLPSVKKIELGDEPRLVIYPSHRLYDGKFANRPWIQEVPDPLVKVSWQSVLEINPEDAKRWKLKEGQLVILRVNNKEVEIPIRYYPRLKRGTISLATGNGHTSYGRYAKGKGVNAFSLLNEAADGGVQWVGMTVTLKKTKKRIAIAHTDGAMTMAGRRIVQTMPLSEYKEKEHELEPTYEEEFEKEFPATAAFYREYHKEKFKEHESPYHWAIVVDLEKCTGCSACVVACMSENNVPVVGEKLITHGREMFWIRIERYFDAKTDGVHFIPMMCQQCDNAPCEPVCPVFATHHDADGLNEQTYNRCVGTRYCSNNCPYKVRRFNWFKYEFPEPLNWQLNPDVTVREKGIMEKCTFCIQRIRYAKDRAKDENRIVRDGEITPACVQACPAEALVFGNSKDPQSKLAKLIRNPRRYRVLEYLNTQPSVTYLKKFSISEEELT